MERIFDNVHFGKAYKTRDGRKAIYFYQNKMSKWHELIVEDENISLSYQDNGLAVGQHLTYPEWSEDIVSEWQENIDAVKLNKMCADYADTIVERKFDETDWLQIADAFEAGYRKALNG